jgi:hypothetical protein
VLNKVFAAFPPEANGYHLGPCGQSYLAATVVVIYNLGIPLLFWWGAARMLNMGTCQLFCTLWCGRRRPRTLTANLETPTTSALLPAPSEDRIVVPALCLTEQLSALTIAIVLLVGVFELLILMPPDPMTGVILSTAFEVRVAGGPHGGCSHKPERRGRIVVRR